MWFTFNTDRFTVKTNGLVPTGKQVAVYWEGYTKCINNTNSKEQGDRDSSVGIATGYGLDGPWIGSRCGRDFSHPSKLALGPTQPPIQWVQGLTRGVKWQGHDVAHPPPSSSEVEDRVELYLYSPFGPSWPVLRWTLPLPLPRNRVLPEELMVPEEILCMLWKPKVHWRTTAIHQSWLSWFVWIQSAVLSRNFVYIGDFYFIYSNNQLVFLMEVHYALLEVRSEYL
jgi:hypothetical protein